MPVAQVIGYVFWLCILVLVVWASTGILRVFGVVAFVLQVLRAFEWVIIPPIP